MTDVFDQAQAQELAEWRRNQALRATPDPAQWDLLSRQTCAGCATSIPEARRKAVPGVQLCVSCQAAAEHHQKQYREGR